MIQIFKIESNKPQNLTWTLIEIVIIFDMHIIENRVFTSCFSVIEIWFRHQFMISHLTSRIHMWSFLNASFIPSLCLGPREVDGIHIDSSSNVEILDAVLSSHYSHTMIQPCLSLLSSLHMRSHLMGSLETRSDMGVGMPIATWCNKLNCETRFSKIDSTPIYASQTKRKR